MRRTTDRTHQIEGERMATTVTGPGTGELVYMHFPIDKARTQETAQVNPVDGTPDLTIWGKATDGTVDGDLQIVDPDWSGPALQKWLATGGNVRASHDPHQEVGRGLEVEITPDGHYVKSLIVDPNAKHKIRNGIFNDYSVGIAFPQIDRDPLGKALNGVIRGGQYTQICELSIVGRGSNSNSRFQLVKSLGGAVRFVGKMTREPMIVPVESDFVTVSVPTTAKIKFSPRDLKKLLDARPTIEKRDFDPDVGGGVDRDRIPDEDFADPDHRAFPIVTPKDVADIEPNLHHPNLKGDPDAIRRRAAAIAERKGPDFQARIPDSWKEGSPTDTDKTEKALPENRGKQCPDCKTFVKRSAEKCRCGHSFGPQDDDDGADKSLFPDVTTGSAGPVAVKGRDGDSDDDDGDSDDDDDDSDADSSDDRDEDDDGGEDGPDPGDTDEDDSDEDDSDEDEDSTQKSLRQPVRKGRVTCSKCSGTMKAAHAFCPNCGAKAKIDKIAKPKKVDKGAVTAGRTEPTPGDDVLGEHTEPVPAHREPDGAAIEAFEDDAKLPTDPDLEVKTLTRHRQIGAPDEFGVLHDRLCAAYHPQTAKSAHPYFDIADLDTQPWFDDAMDKAVMGTIDQIGRSDRLWKCASLLKGTPQELVDELHAELHKAFADANPGPGHALTPSAVTPGQFRRPYSTGGNARASFQAQGPNIGPGGFDMIAAADFDRGFLGVGTAADSPANLHEPRPVAPPTVPGRPTRVYYTGAQRENARQAMQAMHDHIAQTFPDLCPMGPELTDTAPANPGVSAVGAPTAKTARRAGRAATGKSADTTRAESASPQGARAQGALVTKAAVLGQDDLIEHLTKSVMPSLVKAAVDAATAPLAEQLEQTRRTLKSARAANKALGARLENLESQADPNVRPFRGFGPTPAPGAQINKSLPGDPANRARREAAAHTVLLASLNDTYLNSPNPVEREAALNQIYTLQGLPT
jgi:hypothetical protein